VNIDVKAEAGADGSVTCRIKTDQGKAAVTFADGEVTLKVASADGDITLTIPESGKNQA
jgi:hypothetical protein